MAVDKIPIGFSQKDLRFFADRVKKERDNATNHKRCKGRKKHAEEVKYLIDIVKGFIGDDDADTKKKADNPDADIRFFHYEMQTPFQIDCFYYKSRRKFCKVKKAKSCFKSSNMIAQTLTGGYG